MSAEADDRAALSTFRGVVSLIPQVLENVETLKARNNTENTDA